MQDGRYPLAPGNVAEHTAEQAYRAFAPIYDEFNARNNHEMWLGEVLLPELEKHGLRTGRVLDVGCGTGRAFEPLLARGWRVTGCDLSAAMLAEAVRKFWDRDRFEAHWRADARDLPASAEPFDLILLLNDVVNYLVEDGDLERAFTGIRNNLAPDGLVCFDANTLSLFRSSFASGDDKAMSVGDWRWVGQTERVESGGIFDARLSGGDIDPHIHRERHYPESEIRGALASAGLECLAALGQREVGDRVVLTEPPNERRDHKVIYVARHRE